MIPISDDNPTLRTPWMTYLLIAATLSSWIFIQGAGLSTVQLAASVCNYGMVAGELTGLVPVGNRVPLDAGLECVVDSDSINLLTPLSHIFLHGGWAHLLMNLLFFWVFGNNVEDSMGRLRFLIFYLVCGLLAAITQILISPRSIVPMVGASGAISGVMGAYLLLYPRVRVNMLFFVFLVPFPAWAVLLWWFGLQLFSGLPQLMSVEPDNMGGVAVWAHIGGFIAGLFLVKTFENKELVRERTVIRHRRHPDHP